MAKIYCKSSYLLRRDKAANWSAKNPILREGEEGYETDTGRRKIGDGTTAWKELFYTVDQSYDPESLNAQSGLAVKEAVTAEQQRADNTFANALKCSKSGSAILIDDISPVTHDMSVKVRGKNLFDEKQITGCIDGDSEVEYSRYGEVIDGCLVSKLATYDRGTMWNGFKIYLEKNETYTLSADAYFGTNKEGTKRVTVGFIMKNSDGTLKDFTNLVTLSTWDKWEHITTQLNVTESGYYYLRLQATGGAAQYTDMDARFKNIQVEIGTNATAYTPYVPDLTAVKVSKLGKNLLNIHNRVLADKSTDTIVGSDTYRVFTGNQVFIGMNGLSWFPHNVRDFNISNDGTVIYTNSLGNSTSRFYGIGFDISVKPNKTYTFSAVSEQGVLKISFYDKDGKWIRDVVKEGLNVTVTTNDDECWCIVALIVIIQNPTNPIKFSNIQIELSNTATDYEPYITPTDYTPTEDGTVNGITSISQNMTVTTDTEGVVIDMTYNADTKMYIDNKLAEISAAIVNS